jgi:transposase InsO family protein
MTYSNDPHLPVVRREAVRLIKLRHWTIRKTARYLGYNPSTVSRWLKKAPTDLRQVIPTQSSRPKTHPKMLSKKVISEIIEERIKHNRCAEVVRRQLELNGTKVSLSSVKRTLKRTNLIRPRSPWKKWHYSLPRPIAENKGDLLQLDTVHFQTSNGKRFYVYTIVDLYSRWAYAKVVKKIGAGISVKFLAEAKSIARFDFKMVQTDHGPEFTKYFTLKTNQLKISHRHSRVRKSNDNAHVERFNRTIQEECFGVEKPVSFERYSALIENYLNYYNNDRLHLGLGLKTPAQVLQRY